jgi:membrane protein implicated in regulation of membrane protease activity
MGRRILLRAPSEEDVLPEDDRRRSLRELIGKVGTAETMMLPSGAVKVEGRTVNAMSQGMAIETGQTVRVIEVQGNTIVVRPLDEGESPREATAEEDMLAQPLDKLGLDPLDDPLA